MKFVIVVDRISETSGGVNVLCELAKRIADKGYESSIFLRHKETAPNNKIYQKYITESEIDDDTYVIYPEMDVGNCLKAKNIIRWVLYGSHMYEQYGSNEIIYYLAPFCKSNVIKQQLSIMHVPEGSMNYNMPRTNEICYIVKKGYYLSKIRNAFQRYHITNGINLDSIRTHSELTQIFNTTKYFFCYDPCSFLVIFALLCGCIVYIEPIDNYTEEEWLYSVSFNKCGRLKGLAYGTENLEYARSTIHEAAEQCKHLIEKSNATVDTFLDDIVNKNYLIEPCFKFNDSPYSFQHVFK
jgi:hypothetical protein